MTTLLAGLLVSPVFFDPLAGILIGGSVGLVAAFLGAAFVGTILNALWRSAGQQLRVPVQGSPGADQHLSEAA